MLGAIAFLLFLAGVSIVIIATEEWNPALIVPIVFIVIALIIVLYNVKNPTAMDVYRNKTTLEITYRDGVPIDSTVVYKRN